MDREIFDRLVEVDRLVLVNVVDNETDGISSACASCSALNPLHDGVYTGEFTRHIQDAMRKQLGHSGELDLRCLLYAGHGLSLLLTAEKAGAQHTIMVDGGQDPILWRMNAEKLRLEPRSIEAAVLSHWHSDHSRGLSAIAELAGSARVSDPSLAPIVFDLHPDRPEHRGIEQADGSYIPLNEDVSFTDLEVPGCSVQLHREPHTLLDDFFYISGIIPRNTEFEVGLPSHGSQAADGTWQKDPLLLDERYVAIKVKGRGVVVISSCSHAGIVNVCRDVQRLSGLPLLAVIGGFHLAGRECEPRISQTVENLLALQPRVVIPGHCTGWRAKHALAAAFGDRYQPLVVGATYEFHATQ